MKADSHVTENNRSPNNHKPLQVPGAHFDNPVRIKCVFCFFGGEVNETSGM